MKTLNVNCSNIWFTSDLHFFHKNIIKYCNRPYDDVDEMNEAIIDNWNSLISKNDTVFILGDVSFRKLNEIEYLLDQLNGNKVLVIGNHDHHSVTRYFKEAHDMLMLNVTLDDGTSTMVHLSHYPLEVWNRKSSGAIHLHGHEHGNLDNRDKYNYKRLDVGLDSHDWKPINWETITDILTSRYMLRQKNEPSNIEFNRRSFGTLE